MTPSRLFVATSLLSAQVPPACADVGPSGSARGQVRVPRNQQRSTSSKLKRKPGPEPGPEPGPKPQKKRKQRREQRALQRVNPAAEPQQQQQLQQLQAPAVSPHERAVRARIIDVATARAAAFVREENAAAARHDHVRRCISWEQQQQVAMSMPMPSPSSPWPPVADYEDDEEFMKAAQSAAKVLLGPESQQLPHHTFHQASPAASAPVFPPYGSSSTTYPSVPQGPGPALGPYPGFGAYPATPKPRQAPAPLQIPGQLLTLGSSSSSGGSGPTVCINPFLSPRAPRVQRSPSDLGTYSPAGSGPRSSSLSPHSSRIPSPTTPTTLPLPLALASAAEDAFLDELELDFFFSN